MQKKRLYSDYLKACGSGEGRNSHYCHCCLIWHRSLNKGSFFCLEEKRMKLYFAPMEGITGYLYRNVFHDFFGAGIDKYFAPFIVPTRGTSVKSRTVRDI